MEIVNNNNSNSNCNQQTLTHLLYYKIIDYIVDDYKGCGVDEKIRLAKVCWLFHQRVSSRLSIPLLIPPLPLPQSKYSILRDIKTLHLGFDYEDDIYDPEVVKRIQELDRVRGLKINFQLMSQVEALRPVPDIINLFNKDIERLEVEFRQRGLKEIFELVSFGNLKILDLTTFQDSIRDIKSLFVKGCKNGWLKKLKVSYLGDDSLLELITIIEENNVNDDLEHLTIRVSSDIDGYTPSLLYSVTSLFTFLTDSKYKNLKTFGYYSYHDDSYVPFIKFIGDNTTITKYNVSGLPSPTIQAIGQYQHVKKLKYLQTAAHIKFNLSFPYIEHLSIDNRDENVFSNHQLIDSSTSPNIKSLHFDRYQFKSITNYTGILQNGGIQEITGLPLFPEFLDTICTTNKSLKIVQVYNHRDMSEVDFNNILSKISQCPTIHYFKYVDRLKSKSTISNIPIGTKYHGFTLVSSYHSKNYFRYPNVHIYIWIDQSKY